MTPLSKINGLIGKISLEDIAKIIPGWLHVNTITDIAPIYICPQMEADLQISREEVVERGAEYLYDVVHPDSTSSVVPKLQELIESSDEDKVVTFFQKIRLPNGGYVWFITNSMIHKEMQCIVSISNRVDELMDLNKKVETILDNNTYIKANLEKYDRLSPREKEVIKTLTNESGTIEEIAQNLSISPNTLKTHRQNIYKKLELSSIRDLIQFANNFGLH